MIGEEHRNMFKKNPKEWILFGVFIIVFAVMTALSPSRFLSGTNLQSMVFQLPEFGLFALAMTVTILTGGINLSVITSGTMGSILAATVMSTMYKSGADPTVTIALAILVAIVSSCAAGAINGILVSYVGAPAMMATLGTSTLFEGIGLLISKGNSISGFPTEFFWFGNGTIIGIPVPMIIFVIIAVITFILLEHTKWGQSVYMVGCNPTAAKFSGINVGSVMLRVYIYSGFLGGIATIIMMSRYNSARIDYGSSYLMQTVTAAVLGGVAITGGYGKVIGVVLAVLTLQSISSGLNIVGVDTNLSTVITGLLLIGVLAINFISAMTASKKKTAAKQK